MPPRVCKCSQVRFLYVRPEGGGLGHVASRVAAELRLQGHSVDELVLGGSRVPAWTAARDVWRSRERVRASEVVLIELGRTGLDAFWVGLWAARLGVPVAALVHDVPHLVRHPAAALVPRGDGLRDVIAYRVVARLLDRRVEASFRSAVRAWGVMGSRAAETAAEMGLTGVSVVCHGTDPAVGGVAPEESSYALFAGTLGPSKGLDVLLHAWSAVLGNVAHELRVVGDAEPGAWLDEQHAASNASDRVVWVTGANDEEFRRQVANSAVVVLPYRTANPASGVLIHALTESRPVIATEISPFREAVGDGRDGILIPPDDPPALAAALSRLLGDPALLQRMGRSARERKTPPSWAEHAGDVLAVARRATAVRLLHVSQPTDGGTATVLCDLVASAVEHGLKVEVASPPSAEFQGTVERCGARWSQADMRRAPAMREISTIVVLRRAIRRSDLIVLHSSKAGFLGRLAVLTIPRRQRPPVIFMPHGWSWLVGGRAASVYAGAERLLVRAADRIVAVSPVEAEAGARMLGSRAPIVTIENGVDLTRFVHPPVGTRIDGLIVCVGRLARQKGQDVLVRALALLPHARLRLVGDGPDYAALKDLAAQLGVAERVDFVGFADPLPHLHEATVVALPSRWEGLPLTLLEAMASGAPVLPSRPAAGLTFLGVGRVIDSEDPAEWADALRLLLADDAGRETLAEAGIARVRESYQLADALVRHRAVWQQLVGTR